MRERKRRKSIRAEPSTQLFITSFMVEKEKPKIKLEPAYEDEEKKIKLEFEDKEKNTD